jgi:hypothetical protein
MHRLTHRAQLATVTLAAGLLVAVPATAQAQAPDQQRQQAFTAAGEFGVPESVLLGVAYLESRWDYNAGTPSTAAGYGPMHLTDLRAAGSGSHHDDGEEDFRGDDARAAVRPQTPPPTQPPPELQTIDVAARLPTKDVAWHAGNWYVNSKSVGIEHEGFATKGTWYTEAMYRASSKLVRYLTAKYGIPLDRAHILGHDNVPGTVPATIKGMHWDPGPYWTGRTISTCSARRSTTDWASPAPAW